MLIWWESGPYGGTELQAHYLAPSPAQRGIYHSHNSSTARFTWLPTNNAMQGTNFSHSPYSLLVIRVAGVSQLVIAKGVRLIRCSLASLPRPSKLLEVEEEPPESFERYRPRVVWAR
jgi:hypothetical protein